MIWFSHGLPKNSPSVRPCASDAPYQYVHSLIMRSASAALNRLVFVVTHAVMKPPYEPPVKPIRVESTSGRLATMLTARMRSSKSRPPQSPRLAYVNSVFVPLDPRGFVNSTMNPAPARLWNSSNHPSLYSECGPPWMYSTTGYFFDAV